MSPRKKVSKSNIWSYSTGRDEARVVATERVEAGRDRVVILRYTDPRKTGRDKRAKRALDVRVRDERGRLAPQAISEAQDAADALSARLRQGQGAGEASGITDGPITVFKGFTLVADPETGAHPGKQGAMRRKRLLASRDTLAKTDLLGPDKTFREIKKSVIRDVWRTLARRNEAAGTSGPRAAEILIVDLFAVANWLRADDELVVSPTDAVAPPKWRKDLKADWVGITGKPVRIRRERHEAEEQERIFQNLYSEGVDPRVALLVELGAELRGGQVLRLRRSAVHLEPDAKGYAPHGQFLVDGVGKKGGTQVAMTKSQREALENALQGYLRDCEAGFLTKNIEDYYLFAPFKIKVAGTATPRNADNSRPMGRQQMLRAFHKLERAAGIVPVPGRGWYGLRRLSADLANDVETDTRVLNQAGGWAQGSTVREDTYQDTDRLKIAAKVAIVREKMRAPKPKEEVATVPE